jgi:hypothetical protein
MARIITKELAEKIADKLDATYENDGSHQIAYIHYKGLLVAEFGIRRCSEKDKGHDYVPGQIHMTPGKAKHFAQCHISKEQWVELMQEKGIIPKEEDPNTEAEKNDA